MSFQQIQPGNMQFNGPPLMGRFVCRDPTSQASSTAVRFQPPPPVPPPMMVMRQPQPPPQPTMVVAQPPPPQVQEQQKFCFVLEEGQTLPKGPFYVQVSTDQNGTKTATAVGVAQPVQQPDPRKYCLILGEGESLPKEPFYVQIASGAKTTTATPVGNAPTWNQTGTNMAAPYQQYYDQFNPYTPRQPPPPQKPYELVYSPSWYTDK